MRYFITILTIFIRFIRMKLHVNRLIVDAIYMHLHIAALLWYNICIVFQSDQCRYCITVLVHFDHALSVVRPSVRRPSVRPSLSLLFSTSSLKSLDGIQRNLTGSKISTSSTKFVFFGPIGKKFAPASDWLRNFQLLLNRWTESNETLQEASSQRPLPSLCFRADQKNTMGASTSDWLIHFFTSL